MQFAVLFNAAAGSADRDKAKTVLARLASAGPATLHRLDEPGGLEQALDSGARRLVVVGGDGTLHRVVADLWDAGCLGEYELALIPAGTGNDLARSVGLPTDAEAAAELAAAGQVRQFDLIQFDLIAGSETVVVNAVHAGIGAEAGRLADPLKDAAGPVAYPLGATAAAVTTGGWEVEVHADGARVAGGKALMVGICNAPTIGGGTPLAPGADPADGRLDLVVVTATGPVERAAFGAALRAGGHLDRDDVLHVQATEVRIEGDPLPYDADGELIGEHETTTWRVEPAAWRLVTRR